MVIDCCSQQRTYEKFFGLLGGVSSNSYIKCACLFGGAPNQNGIIGIFLIYNYSSVYNLIVILLKFLVFATNYFFRDSVY